MAEARLLGVFQDPARAAAAVRALRERGLSRLEAYSPVPHEALDAALGSAVSPVRGYTLIGGLLGFASGLALTQWTSLALPLVTGGKPIVSVPPFLIIAFETAILFGALATVAGFLLNAGLPRRAPSIAYDPRFSEDRCGVLVTASEEQAGAARELLAAAGALEVRGA